MSLTLVVVQPTSLCNLNCSYCYVPNRRDKTIMDDRTLSRSIFATLESSLVDDWVEYLWHSGEPLAAGIGFYERAVEYIHDALERTGRRISVYNSLQTNGVLINDEWARFFKENNFGVGVSIDGPAFLHDAHRQSWTGKPSHSKVMSGLRRLQDMEIRPTALCVLTANSLNYPEEIISFFIESGVDRVAFNVEEIDNANTSSSMSLGLVENRLLLEKRYTKFLERLFDAWWPHRKKLKVREFADTAAMVSAKLADRDFYRTPDETTTLGILTIMKNGDLTTYSPEFAGAKSSKYSDFIIGNIHSSDLNEVTKDSVFMLMQNDVEESKCMCAANCRYFDLCGGEFVSNRYFETGTLVGTESSACRLHRQGVIDVVLKQLKAKSTTSATRDL